jgi:NADH-quinone oxidoreductase subunit G
VGTNCFLKGSQGIVHELLDKVDQEQLHDQVEINASFCFEHCEHGPTVQIDGKTLHHCTGKKVCSAVEQKLNEKARTE